jgi:hypothetical protein
VTVWWCFCLQDDDPPRLAFTPEEERAAAAAAAAAAEGEGEARYGSSSISQRGGDAGGGGGSGGGGKAPPLNPCPGRPGPGMPPWSSDLRHFLSQVQESVKREEGLSGGGLYMCLHLLCFDTVSLRTFFVCLLLLCNAA